MGGRALLPLIPSLPKVTSLMALGTALDRPSGGGDEDDDDGHSKTQWTWYCRKCPVLIMMMLVIFNCTCYYTWVEW